jgi:putative transposase
VSFTALEKNQASPIEVKRQWIEPDHPSISIARQYELVGVPRSTYYYEPVAESEQNLLLMRLIDERYLRTPFYGSPRMTAWLRQQGFEVNRKRVSRLMRLMGLEATYPKPRLSQSAPGHRVYPYLLRNLPITAVNQVWSTDITYIRLARGFICLVAVIDWFSRYVLAWEVSVKLETAFCLSALEWALTKARPEIFNTDQGSQFTSSDFTGALEQAGIRISMDDRGRALDNVFVERLWRSVTYEEVFLKDYRSVSEAIESLGWYFEFYNRERLHQALDYRTPESVWLAA